MYSNPSGRVKALRAAVRAALEDVLADPAVAALDARTGGAVRESLQVPDIIHSTIVRFAAPLQDPAAFRAAFAKAAAAWAPCTVTVDAVALALEPVAYMHADPATAAILYQPLSEGGFEAVLRMPTEGGDRDEGLTLSAVLPTLAALAGVVLAFGAIAAALSDLNNER
uniref:Uncharacterized protein n=2 Tax=Phaeomonas parva TaxID=124430 RepID=A0A7S1UL27_9STRA|mmetsp:Transcript_7368/g.21463  ORF Transcript_7368/g.21463 Transcript_7368/m.21463 type:complete len:168 (+) Transcript_7368:289-792(+)